VAKLKVAINGFGRIGRNFLRCWHGRKNSPLDVIVVNDSGGVKNVSEVNCISIGRMVLEKSE
jgi:glyceraldehyde-3-phosphate dehydrogenase (NAD(P))